MAYTAKAEAILALTDASYDNWNPAMDKIRVEISKWDFIGYKRVETFDQILAKELLANPARRATRVAILVAIGEMQEPKYPAPVVYSKKTRGSGKKTEDGKTARKAA
jgi:hypothetical protein